MERVTRERWMHGGQRSRFTPFATNTDWLLIDSIRVLATGRALHLTLGRNAYGRDSATVVTDSRGRVRTLTSAFPRFRAPEIRWPDDSAGYERMMRFRGEGRLRLAESRLWDLILAIPSGSLRSGARWSDTLARSALDGANMQQLSGTRAFAVVRDTIVDGRRLWIVRDSAPVRYEERYVERERTLDTLVSVTRRGTGTVRGTSLYDTTLRLVRSRQDTLTIVGEATLRYPDGRTFRTPARLERTQSWTLHDSVQYLASRNAARARAEREMGGMVIVPTPGDQRLLAGDSILRDSLIRAWREAHDPDVAARLYSRLSRGADARVRARLDSLRIADGDTAFFYGWLSNRAYSGIRPADSSDIRAMLPFMENPGRAWALNRSRDWLYENLAQALRTWPPAAQDSGDRVGCTPGACELLGRQLGAREPRLRDVALVARFAVDPQRWGDSVIERAGPLHPLLTPVAAVARGVGAPWSASSKEAVPPPGSDWRAWLDWMSGRDSATIARDAQMARRYDWARDTTTRPRFEESHRVALRMYMHRTGRDVLSELREGYRTAPDHHARLVFGTMLNGLRALSLTEQEIVDAFTSGDSARSTLARQVFIGQFHRDAKPLDPADSAPFIDRLLSVLVENAPLWRQGTDDLYGRRPLSRPELHARRGRVLIRVAGIPESLRQKWNGKVEFVDAGHAIDVREAAVVYTIAPVLSTGRFAMVTVDAAEQLARPADSAPAHYASGTTYYLMRVGEEWVIVATSAWVT